MNRKIFDDAERTGAVRDCIDAAAHLEETRGCVRRARFDVEHGIYARRHGRLIDPCAMSICRRQRNERIDPSHVRIRRTVRHALEEQAPGSLAREPLSLGTEGGRRTPAEECPDRVVHADIARVAACTIWRRSGHTELAATQVLNWVLSASTISATVR